MRRTAKQLRGDAWRTRQLAGHGTFNGVYELLDRAISREVSVGAGLRALEDRGDVFLDRKR
jgi:hypothetical protein